MKISVFLSVFLRYFSFAWLVFYLPPSFSQPACRCLQTTWRLTVICSRFPKPTIWAKKKLTGLRSHVPVPDNTAVAIHLGGVGMATNTPIMITMNLPKRTYGLRMSMATEDDILHLVITGTTEPLAGIHLHRVIQMSKGHQGPLRGTPKTRRYAMTHRGDPHRREDVVTPGPEDTTLQITHAIPLVTTMANAPPDKGTHIAPRAASPSREWTCRANCQVQLYCFVELIDANHYKIH